MYRRMADFEKQWAFETEATLKVLRAIPDGAMGQLVAPGGRTLGFLAWHLTTTLSEFPEQAGVHTTAPKPDVAVPATMAEIATAYELAAKSTIEAFLGAWNDGMLAEEIPMYGEQWERAFVLSAILAHQAHHRGQMTVLMRQAGVAVPGIYGPAKEEWAAMGMAALP